MHHRTPIIEVDHYESTSNSYSVLALSVLEYAFKDLKTLSASKEISIKAGSTPSVVTLAEAVELVDFFTQEESTLNLFCHLADLCKAHVCKLVADMVKIVRKKIVIEGRKLLELKSRNNGKMSLLNLNALNLLRERGYA